MKTYFQQKKCVVSIAIFIFSFICTYSMSIDVALSSSGGVPRSKTEERQDEGRDSQTHDVSPVPTTSTEQPDTTGPVLLRIPPPEPTPQTRTPPPEGPIRRVTPTQPPTRERISPTTTPIVRTPPTAGGVGLEPEVSQALETIEQYSPALAERLIFILQLENTLKEKTALLEEARKNGNEELEAQLEKEINSLTIRLMMEKSDIVNKMSDDPYSKHTGGGTVRRVIMLVAEIIERQSPADQMEREETQRDMIDRRDEMMDERRESIRDMDEERFREERYIPQGPEPDI
ncbi:MAG: hypothetical protein JSW40_09505 [Candidatus Omnitrophota bacterium]|nr:MAG: hypothetical protein JSW40_09505 [Candidatus Omnitrophota bacterium]